MKNYKLKPDKDVFKDSELGRSKQFWDNVSKLYGKWIKIGMVLLLLFSYLIVGSVRDQFAALRDSFYHKGFGNVLVLGFHPATLIIFFIFFMIISYLAGKFYNPDHYNEELGVVQADTGEAGTATRLHDSDEKSNTFFSSNGTERKENFLGEDMEHEGIMLSLKPLSGFNGNLLAVGAPGSGKSRCLIIPWIMQTIRRGESAILTDTKADLYGKCKLMAEAHGYTVKFINFDAESISHSDRIDFFLAMSRSDTACEGYAKTIVKNLGSGDEKGFWPLAEQNLLQFVMLYIRHSDDIGYEKSLYGIAQYIIDKTVPDIVADINNLGDPKERPELALCISHGKSWANSSDKVKDDSKGGLSTQFTKLMDSTIHKVTTGESAEYGDLDTEAGDGEAGFRDPGRKPCLYFVNCSAKSDALQYLSALYFDVQIAELMNLAAECGGELPVHVTLLMDEFANVGIIPEWDKKIAVLRSNGIDAIMMVQNIEQLEKNYPDGAANTIMNACTTQILLTTNAGETAKVFHDRAGSMTIVSDSTGSDGQVKKSKTSRDIYTLDEIYRLPADRLLVSVSGTNPIEVKRVDYSRYPMAKELTPINALRYAPKWVRDMDPSMYPIYGITEDMYDMNPVYPKVNLWFPHKDGSGYKLLPAKPFMRDTPKPGMELIEEQYGIKPSPLPRPKKSIFGSKSTEKSKKRADETPPDTNNDDGEVVYMDEDGNIIPPEDLDKYNVL